MPRIEASAPEHSRCRPVRDGEQQVGHDRGRRVGGQRGVGGEAAEHPGADAEAEPPARAARRDAARTANSNSTPKHEGPHDVDGRRSPPESRAPAVAPGSGRSAAPSRSPRRPPPGRCRRSSDERAAPGREGAPRPARCPGLRRGGSAVRSVLAWGIPQTSQYRLRSHQPTRAVRHAPCGHHRRRRRYAGMISVELSETSPRRPPMITIDLTAAERAAGALSAEHRRVAVEALRRDGFVVVNDVVDPPTSTCCTSACVADLACSRPRRTRRTTGTRATSSRIRRRSRRTCSPTCCSTRT